MAALAALGIELALARIGIGLELRLTAALALAGALGGSKLIQAGLEPGRLRWGSTLGLPLLAGMAMLAPWLGLQLVPAAFAGGLPSRAALVLPSVLWLLLAGPITEELLYRGLIQQGLKQAWGPGFAALVSASSFAWAHELAGAGAGPQHFLAGLVLAAAAERTGGWWVPAILHAAGNAGWLLLALQR